MCLLSYFQISLDEFFPVLSGFFFLMGAYIIPFLPLLIAESPPLHPVIYSGDRQFGKTVVSKHAFHCYLAGSTHIQFDFLFAAQQFRKRCFLDVVVQKLASQDINVGPGMLEDGSLEIWVAV